MQCSIHGKHDNFMPGEGWTDSHLARCILQEKNLSFGSFSTNVSRGDNFCDCLFSSLITKFLRKRYLLLKKKCSWVAFFFHSFRVDSIDKENKVLQSCLICKCLNTPCQTPLILFGHPFNNSGTYNIITLFYLSAIFRVVHKVKRRSIQVLTGRYYT